MHATHRAKMPRGSLGKFTSLRLHSHCISLLLIMAMSIDWTPNHFFAHLMAHCKLCLHVKRCSGPLGKSTTCMTKQLKAKHGVKLQWFCGSVHQ